jgi:uncharacterized membrane protein
VTSVDSAGDESAQSLGISPAALSAAISSGGGAGGAGCFVNSVAIAGSYQALWVLVILTITMVIVAGIRRKASGAKNRELSNED